MGYKVKLKIFEGPLDLLLYFIKKDEIDIYDIPIAKITDQYLEYLEVMKLLDLNIAGEFLVMAATLMQIKSKMLLPQLQEEAEEVEEEDPRAELMRRLLEYKRFKEAASELQDKAQRQKDYFGRSVKAGLDDDKTEESFEASIFDLIAAFDKIMKDVPKKLFYEVVRDEFTIEGKMHDIFHLLVDRPAISFKELFKKSQNKMEIITTFLALLELIRLKEVVTRQSKPFGDVRIERNKELITPLRRSV